MWCGGETSVVDLAAALGISDTDVAVCIYYEPSLSTLEFAFDDFVRTGKSIVQGSGTAAPSFGRPSDMTNHIWKHLDRFIPHDQACPAFLGFSRGISSYGICSTLLLLAKQVERWD